MGFLDIFRKKEGSELVKREDLMFAFSKVRNDVSNMNNWLSYLHSENLNAKELLSELKNNHSVSRTDIEHLKGWIQHFNDFNREMVGYIGDVNNKLGELNSHFSYFQKELEALKGKSNLYSGTTEALKSELKAHIDSFLHKEVALRPVERAPEVSPKPVRRSSEGLLEDFRRDLSLSEKELLLQLCKTDKRLSYKDMAILTGKSPNTVKNQINTIRNKGFPLKESMSLSGKRFYLEEQLKRILLNS